MRLTCTFCARKHLAQAIILLGETANGYPDHLWLAAGHLAEASDELAAFPELAAEIRGYRKQLEVAAPTALPQLPLMDVIKRIGALGEPNTYPAASDPNKAYATIGHADHSQNLTTGPGPLFVRSGTATNEPTDRRGHHMAEGGVAPVPVPPGPPQTPPQTEHPQVVAAREAAWKKYGRPGSAPPPPGAEPAQTSPASTRCLICEDRARLKALAQQFATDTTRYRGRLVIMTTLANFARSYSLASVTLEQAHAAAIAGYRVILLVYRNCDMTQCPPLPPEITVLSIVPTLSWKKDEVDVAKAEELKSAMVEWFQILTSRLDGQLHVITHDLLFQSWFVTFACAIHKFSQMSAPPGMAAMFAALRWYHMAHSSVGARPQITAIPGAPGHGAIDPLYWRHTLPRDHHLLVLNYADVQHFGRYYHDENDRPLVGPLSAGSPPALGASGPERIHTLKNPRDIRPFLNMGETASMFTTKYRLHLVDVCMLFPLSLDRVKDKGVRQVVQLLGAMKRMGLSVRLLIAAAHAGGNDEKAMWVQEQARAAGLITQGSVRPPGVVAGVADPPADRGNRGYPDHELEVILTSEAIADHRIKNEGLPPEDISALFHVSNLFIFPSISEAGPLVLMEAALAGCTLVLNQSLPCLRDYIGLPHALWVPWGSLKQPGQEVDGKALDSLAARVWLRMQSDRAGWTKRQVMIEHCLETYGERLVELLEYDGNTPTDRVVVEDDGDYDPARDWRTDQPTAATDAADHPRSSSEQDRINADGEARIAAAVADGAELRARLDAQGGPATPGPDDKKGALSEPPPGWNEDQQP